MIATPGLEEPGKGDTGGRRQSGMTTGTEPGAGESHWRVCGVGLLYIHWVTQTKVPCWKIGKKKKEESRLQGIEGGSGVI